MLNRLSELMDDNLEYVFLFGMLIVMVIGIAYLVITYAPCNHHVEYVEQPCTKCIKKNNKVCMESIETTCQVPVYDDGYEYCDSNR